MLDSIRQATNAKQDQLKEKLDQSDKKFSFIKDLEKEPVPEQLMSISTLEYVAWK